MKYTWNFIAVLLLTLFNVVGVFALHHDDHEQDLSKLTLRAGIGNPQSVLRGKDLEQFNKMQHKTVFATTLAKIKDHSKKFDDQRLIDARRHIAQVALPPEFDRPQILLLAESLGFSNNENEESLATKFVRLALLIRDMYDADNLVSKGLGIVQMTPQLSKQEIHFYVTEALEYAIKNFKTLEQTITDDRVIDLHLTLAQLSLWRLSYGRESMVHRLLDSNTNILPRKSTELKACVLYHLSKVAALLQNPAIPLPPVYNKAIRVLVNNLDDNEKYDLIMMHKQELDRAEEVAKENTFDELQKARGLEAHDENPLTYFTPEHVEIIKKAGRRIGKEDDELALFVYKTMKIYALNKVKSAELYFTQDVLIRYLLASKKISRNDLLQVFFDKCARIRQALVALDAE